MYFESHAHFDDRRFKEDRDTLLKSYPSLGIDYVVNIGCDMKSSKDSIALANRYDHVYATVGYHPHELYNISSQSIEELRGLCMKEKKVVAVGEIGLDYYHDTHPRELQRFWFRQQLRLAESVNKPVIIHSRDASEETFAIMEESKICKGVIHCYSGAAPMAIEYTKMGFYIGIGGVITFPNAKKLVEVVEAIPLDKILIETDSPYLTPSPNRGKRNDSRNLEFIVNKIAELKKTTPENVAKITSDNAKTLFF